MRGVEGMDKSVRQVLSGDTSAISTLRCLKLYLERMGTDFQNGSELQRIAGEALLFFPYLFALIPKHTEGNLEREKVANLLDAQSCVLRRQLDLYHLHDLFQLA